MAPTRPAAFPSIPEPTTLLLLGLGSLILTKMH
ncbi:MAG: PEP-CTERM sorting domain-containing protein [Planctomycetota bacterium]